MTTIRELKKDAKVRLSGNYFKLVFIYLIYGLIIYAFSALASFINSEIMKFIFALLILIFIVPFSFGLVSSFMDIIRGKNMPITEFINIGLKNISKTWKIFLRIILKLLVPIILTIASMSFLLLTLAATVVGGELANYFIISIILFMVSIILLFIMNLYYSLSFYLLKDKPEKTGKEIVKMSHDLMKGNIIKYIGLGISFIGWYLLIFAIGIIISYFLPKQLVSLVAEVGFLLLFPYITTTIIGFYEDILYDKSNAVEKE